MPIQIYRKFHLKKKNWKFSDKKPLIFFYISAQNIDCGYSLEPHAPRALMRARHHYENTPIQIYGKFHLQKTENFQIKNSDIFHISAQNIDCGYSLEPPRRGGSDK